MAAKDAVTELTNHVVALSAAAGRIEGKVDTFITQMGIQDARVTELEVRLRKVENRQHWYSGVAAGIGALFGGAGVKFFHG